MNTKFASKDTTFMSALVLAGALLVAMTPFIADQNLAAQRAATAVVEAARGLAQTATSVTPAAMQPAVLIEPAIIVTAPRITNTAQHNMKGRRAVAPAA